MAEEGKEENVFQDLVDEKNIEGCQGISCDQLVEMVHFDDLDEYHKIKSRIVGLLTVMQELNDACDKADNVDIKVYSLDIVLCNLLAAVDYDTVSHETCVE